MARRERDHTDYFLAVVKIEESLASEDFPEVLVLYHGLFERYGRVFARDAFNACQLAAFSDTSRFRNFYFWCALGRALAPA